MNRLAVLLALAASAGLAQSIPLAAAVTPSRPPVARVQPVVDDDFGARIIDPYRWMESEPKPAFFDYLHGQNDYARAVLARIPGRDALKREIESISGLAARARTVDLAGGRIFYLKRQPGAQIDQLYVRDGANETMLLDPSTLDVGGRHAEIDQFVPSFDGSRVVYGVSVGGSEDSTLHVIETATRKVLPDSIDRAQFASASWAPDGRSFFFARLPASSLTAKAEEQYAHLKVMRHVVGQDPATDTVVLDADHLPFPFKAAEVFPSIGITPGSNYALAALSDGVSPETALYSAPLADVLSGHPAWRRLAVQADDVVGAVVRGDIVDLMTHHDAPRFKIVQTSLAAPDIAKARTIVPQSSGVLTSLAAASDGLYYAQRDGATFSLHRLGANAPEPTTIALPFAGTISPPEEDSGGLLAAPQRPGALVSLESWVRADAWFRYDPATNALTDTAILPPFPRDLSGYVSTETTATARDGTSIPLSIVTRRGLELDGHRPTYLVGYGAYGLSYDPSFSPGFIPWLDRGGIYAVAHVRGGGELGQAWHDAGKIETKQNTIHDFIDCADALIQRGYTDPAHLAGEGTSAGGILIGGAITQRPDLFRAALVRVGATNTVREEFTANGPSNIPEFGTVTNKEQFPYMLKMDAFNQVRRGVAYPAVLLTGGVNDPRVPVWISAKMTAKLQADTSSHRPILLRVDFDAGHGIGSTRKQHDDEVADEFAFLLWQFGEEGYQPDSR